MKAADVMDSVVARLIDGIEAGAGTWSMPWRTLTGSIWPTNAATTNAYRGGNVLVLYLTATDRAYPTGRWATYKQWHSLGAQVRRGERATQAIKWVEAKPNTDDPNQPAEGDAKPRRRLIPVAFSLFNAAQVDNDPHHDHDEALPVLERDGRAEAFFAAIPARIAWASGNPCYQPTYDRIVMPAFDAFNTATDAYATLAHELGHWTGHPSRLARDLTGRFGTDAYAAEELVAELSAAFTCALVGIDTVARTDHTSYLAHWCRILRERPAHLWHVASRAQAATDYLAAHYADPTSPAVAVAA